MPNTQFAATGKAAGTLLAAAAVFLAPEAQAVTRNVNASTVTALHRWVDSADAYTSNQYVITLSAGTYVLAKTLRITKGYVTLKGATDLNGAPNYVLEGGYPNIGGYKRILVVEGASGWNPSFAVQGVTLRGGFVSGNGAGLLVTKGFVSLSDSYIRDNVATTRGSGLFVGANATVNLLNCVVRGNINENSILNDCGGVNGAGGGVAVDGGSFSSYRSTFMENQACRGAAVALYSGFATLESNTLSSNNANKRGGAFFLTKTAQVSLRFNTIAFNKAGTHPLDKVAYEQKYGGGIAMDEFTGTLEMFGNILAKNEAVYSDKPTLGHHGHDCFRKPPSVPTFRHLDNLIGALGNCVELNTGSPPFQGTEAAPVDPLLNPLTQKAGTRGNQFTHAIRNASWAKGLFYFYSTYGNYTPVYCPYDDQLGHRRDWWDPDAAAPRWCDVGAQAFDWYH